jgi:tetratricopeptide (TPR) repeat protein
MVVYPPDREQEVLTLLGNWADIKWANQHALEVANQEVATTEAMEAFFAWFNKGTSHVQLLQYNEAAAAYDKAFAIYATLGADDKQRPYRMMWYQTWPYWAYYYTGRYQDVINLANVTLNETISKPTLEESLYWRGMAELALGNRSAAIKDIRDSVYYNPNFSSGLAQLQAMGVKP